MLCRVALRCVVLCCVALHLGLVRVVCVVCLVLCGPMLCYAVLCNMCVVRAVRIVSAAL